jgi:hypothetical protein
MYVEAFLADLQYLLVLKILIDFKALSMDGAFLLAFVGKGASLTVV